MEKHFSWFPLCPFRLTWPGVTISKPSEPGLHKDREVAVVGSGQEELLWGLAWDSPQGTAPQKKAGMEIKKYKRGLWCGMGGHSVEVGLDPQRSSIVLTYRSQAERRRSQVEGLEMSASQGVYGWSTRA